MANPLDAAREVLRLAGSPWAVLSCKPDHDEMGLTCSYLRNEARKAVPRADVNRVALLAPILARALLDASAPAGEPPASGVRVLATYQARVSESISDTLNVYLDGSKLPIVAATWPGATVGDLVTVTVTGGGTK